MDFGLLYENDNGKYVVLNGVRMADIRLASLVYLFVYVSTYIAYLLHFCVKTSHFHYSTWATPK